MNVFPKCFLDSGRRLKPSSWERVDIVDDKSTSWYLVPITLNANGNGHEIIIYSLNCIHTF